MIGVGAPAVNHTREWQKQSQVVFDKPVSGYTIDQFVPTKEQVPKVVIDRTPLMSLDWISVSDVQPKPKLGAYKFFYAPVSDYVRLDPESGLYSGNFMRKKEAMGQEYFTYIKADYSDPAVVASKELMEEYQETYRNWNESLRGQGTSEPPNPLRLCYDS